MKSRKNLLMMLYTFPYPVYGGNTRNFPLIKLLSKYCNIYLITIIKSKEELKYIPYVKKYVKQIYPVLIPKTKRKFSVKLPCRMYNYISDDLKKQINELISKINFDVLWVAQVYPAYYSKLPIPIRILDTHNIEAQLYRNHIYLEKNSLIKLYNYVEYLKMKQFERKIVKNFNYAIVMSPKEA